MPSPQAAAAVETYEWIDTTKMSHLVANFARAQILIALFDGDPDKWIAFLRTDGTPQELENDLPFALAVKRRMTEDPEHLEHLRSMIEAFSRLLT